LVGPKAQPMGSKQTSPNKKGTFSPLMGRAYGILFSYLGKAVL